MFGEKSPEFVSGKILYCLKTSKLNYVVKETPYSVYITIRKTFIKEENVIENVSNDCIPPIENDLVVELNKVKERNRDLETRLELAKVNFEQLELEKEDFIKKLSSQDDDIESFLQTEKKLNNRIKVLIKENDMKNNIDQNLKAIKDLEERNENLEVINENLESGKSDLNDKVEALCSEIFDLKQNGLQTHSNKALEQRLLGTQNNLREATDSIFVLENTLENKESEIQILKNKLEKESLTDNSCEKCDVTTKTNKESELHIPIHTDESAPSTSKCGICKYESDDEIEMEVHANTNHENHGDFECKKCDVDFKSASRFQSHVCRVHVENPIYGTLYVRSWYDANGCTPIYCSQKNAEVAWLHHENCTNYENPCAAFADIEAEDDNKIEGLEHLKLECFIENGNINWKRVIVECDLSNPQDTT